eukprot:scaffold1400_cov137-Cylindrotheca_fusiformis.AAC.17
MEEMNQRNNSSSSSFSAGSGEPYQKDGSKYGGLEQKSFSDGFGYEPHHAMPVNPSSAHSPVLPESTPSRGLDPDYEAKARARQRGRTISASADHPKTEARRSENTMGLKSKKSPIGSKAGAATGVLASPDRSAGKIRLAPGSEREFVSPKIKAKAKEDPDLSIENGLGGSDQAETVDAEIGALAEGESTLLEVEIAHDFEPAVSDTVRETIQDTRRNHVSQHLLDASESQGGIVTTAFLVENDDASGEEDKLCGAPRKVCYGLIAFVVVVAVAIVAAAAGVLLSRVDDSTSLDSSTSTPSGAPSSIPTVTPRLDIDLLANVLLPGVNISDLNETSPQYLALEWVAYDDPRNMRIEDDLTELLERFSLATLHYATWGLSMANPLQWLGGSTHCNWTFITCENGSVVEMIVAPPSYGFWTLPTEIGNFRNLRALFFGEETWLIGSIPSEVGLLTSATSLQLDSNYLTGTLPTEIGNLNLLESFNVALNGLSDRVPSEIGLLSSLTSLQLEYNFFNGTLPIEIASLRKISSLGLSRNWFEGTIHTEFGMLTNLSTLSLRDTRLSGSIPSELGLLSDTLSILDLGQNNLSGLVPTELGALTRLAVLSARSITDMAGSIPTELGRLSLLTSLDLSNSSLTGTIPSELGNMSLLTSLDISSNRLVGTIPSDIGNLRQLTLLNLSGNTGLTGTVPVEVGQMESIMMAYFHSTSITGGLDDLAFCRNRFLGYFIVWSDCGGEIPEVTCVCCTNCCNMYGTDCVLT